MLCSRSTTIALVGLLGLLIAARQVHAQDELFQPSKDPAVFKAQLLQFNLLTRKNISNIQALSPDDSSPLDPYDLADKPWPCSRRFDSPKADFETSSWLAPDCASPRDFPQPLSAPKQEFLLARKCSEHVV